MGYIELEDLVSYKYSRELSREVWSIYNVMHWQMKKVLGDQLVRSTDSIGVNIAEGYGRFHYLDKNRFYYYARGSLLETKHWLALARERNLVDDLKIKKINNLLRQISITLNGLIQSQLKRKR